MNTGRSAHPTIVGSPRLAYLIFAQAKSGTTWMQRLLSAHPEVHCSESRLVGDFFKGDNPTGPALTVEKFVAGMLRHFHIPDPAPAARSADFSLALLANIINAIADTTRAYAGKRIYGEKLTPYPRTAAASIDSLHAYNPGLAFIHLVRDGRDVVVSGYAHWANIRINAAKAANNPAEAARLQAELDARRVPDQIIDEATANWVENVAAGIEGEDRFDRSLRLRYEDLLDDTANHAQTLFKLIGADSSLPVVNAAVAAASFEKLSGGRESGDENRASFFRKGIAGDFASWLSPAQLARFELRAGPLMDQLGYARASTAPAIDFPRVQTPPRQPGVARTGPRSA